MAKFESKTNTQGFAKIILEEDPSAGTYIYVYESAQSKVPERDRLQDIDTPTAQEFCLEDYGVPLASWVKLSG